MMRDAATSSDVIETKAIDAVVAQFEQLPLAQRPEYGATQFREWLETQVRSLARGLVGTVYAPHAEKHGVNSDLIAVEQALSSGSVHTRTPVAAYADHLVIAADQANNGILTRAEADVWKALTNPTREAVGELTKYFMAVIRPDLSVSSMSLPNAAERTVLAAREDRLAA